MRRPLMTLAVALPVMLALGCATTPTGGGDRFGARSAWLYVAIVAVGYMVSRGLAKAGSREPYWADSSDLPGGDEDRS